MGEDIIQCFIDVNSRDSVKQILLKALAGEETSNYEFPLYTKDHRKLDILFSATAKREKKLIINPNRDPSNSSSSHNISGT